MMYTTTVKSAEGVTILFIVLLVGIALVYINSRMNLAADIAHTFEKNIIADYSVAITAEISRIYYSGEYGKSDGSVAGKYRHYPETLIVIKPVNWQIYTNNGINFFHVTSFFNGPNNCNADYQLPCIVLSADKSTETTSSSGRLRTECLNLSQVNLAKMFGNCDQKISVNMSEYFSDKSVEFTSISCLNLLISLNYL